MVLVRALAASALAILILAPAGASSQAWLDLETGVVFSVRNDVRIPGVGGTKVSLVDDLAADHEPFFRARVGYSFAKRHHLSLLIAQLSLPASGDPPRDLQFNGVIFPAETPLKAEYRFDSYRLTYRYTLASRERFEAGIGATGKIRDAEIKIESKTAGASKKNTGFVPLVNFFVRWSFSPDFWAVLEGDALAAPQGRAEDVLVAVQYWPSERFGFKGGWRFLEGGADNDEVYNFAFLSYAVVGFYANF
jgi:hypothetical protein